MSSKKIDDENLERLLHYYVFLEEVLFWTMAKSMVLESNFT